MSDAPQERILEPDPITSEVPIYRWSELRDEQKANVEERVLDILTKAPGLWIYGLPMERYLRIPAMSSSGIESSRRSWAHYRHDRDNPSDPSKVMLEGTALHTALLEPELFSEQYVVIGRCEATKKSDGKRCTNTGKVARGGQAFCGTHDPADGAPMEEGVEVVDEDTLARIEAGRDAILSHPDAGAFFRGEGASEVTGVWRDPETHVACKIRLDREIKRADVHMDVKWTASAEAGAFYYTCKRLGYFRKAAWYRRGLTALGRPADGSVLVAAEQKPPHGVQCFILDEGDLSAWSAKISGHLHDYVGCIKNNEWPGYPTGLTPISLKPWDLPDDEELPDFEDEDSEDTDSSEED